MRVRSSIPALLSVVLAASACETTSHGTLEANETQLTVAPSASTIVTGTKIQLHLTARDENGVPATPAAVTWATSDPRVAIVAPDGVVTAYATGAAQITALWKDVKGRSTVTVINGITASTPCSTKDTGSPLLFLKKACVAK
jgi:uncharacterized protein YjdB